MLIGVLIQPDEVDIALASVGRDRVGNLRAPAQVGVAANEYFVPPFKTRYLKLITCSLRMAYQPTLPEV